MAIDLVTSGANFMRISVLLAVQACKTNIPSAMFGSKRLYPLVDLIPAGFWCRHPTPTWNHSTRGINPSHLISVRLHPPAKTLLSIQQYTTAHQHNRSNTSLV